MTSLVGALFGSWTVSRDWTKEEDALVCSLVKEMGPKWSCIAKSFQGRSESSIRNRYARLQQGPPPEKPPRDRSTEMPWSAKNDEMLRHAFSVHGPKWSTITKQYFPERTSNAVRNRFHRNIANAKIAASAASDVREPSPTPVLPAEPLSNMPLSGTPTPNLHPLVAGGACYNQQSFDQASMHRAAASPLVLVQSMPMAPMPSLLPPNSNMQCSPMPVQTVRPLNTVVPIQVQHVNSNVPAQSCSPMPVQPVQPAQPVNTVVQVQVQHAMSAATSAAQPCQQYAFVTAPSVQQQQQLRCAVPKAVPVDTPAQPIFDGVANRSMYGNQLPEVCHGMLHAHPFSLLTHPLHAPSLRIFCRVSFEIDLTLNHFPLNNRYR